MSIGAPRVAARALAVPLVALVVGLGFGLGLGFGPPAAAQTAGPAQAAGAAQPAGAAPRVIHLAAAGNDAFDGCCVSGSANGKGPVRTLARAFELVRDVRGSGRWPAGGIVIQVAPGLYRMADVLTLGAEVSGEPGAPVVVKAAQAGRPRSARFVGSVPLAKTPLETGSATTAGLQALVADPGGLPLSAASQVYRDGRPLPIARWPKAEPARVRSVDGDTVRLSGGPVPPLAPGTMLVGFTMHEWQHESLPVSAGQGSALTVPGAAQRVAAGAAVHLTGSPGFIFGGESWAIDLANDRVLLPRESRADGIEASALPTFIKAEGVRHLRLEGLSFCYATGNALEFAKAVDVVLADVEICHAGGWAARINGQASGIRDSHVHDVGAGGVYLFGGNRQTLAPGGMFAEHSVFEGLARRVKSYSPAVYVEGVGGLVRGNIVRDSPHVGIMFSGNDQQIALNEISEVVKESGDMGAIYSGRNWTFRGNQVLGNMIYDVPGPGPSGARGIYLDDQFSAARVEGNLIANVANGVFIGGGRDNVVRRNLFFASNPAIHLDARGLDNPAMISGNGPQLETRLAEVPIDSPVYRERFPELARIRDEQPMAPQGNVFADNVMVDSKPLELYGRSPSKYVDGQPGTAVRVHYFRGWSGRPQPDWLDPVRKTVPAAADHFPWVAFEAANARARAAR